MSDNWLIFIPENPDYIPDKPVQELGLRAFKSFVPDADEVSIESSLNVRFIDCGGNFQKVICPFCQTTIDLDFWGNAMETAYKVDFSQLGIIAPCCKRQVTLNELLYDWPQGFARFSLKAMNPNITDISSEQSSSLEQLLGTRLKRIWRHI